MGVYLPVQFDELAYTVLASSAEPEHVVSNHGTPWNKTDVKYRELTRQRESNRQHAQTMCTFNLSKSKQSKTLFRIQYVADWFSSCPRVLMHRCLCCALVFCTKHQTLYRAADPNGSLLWDCVSYQLFVAPCTQTLRCLQA